MASSIDTGCNIEKNPDTRSKFWSSPQELRAMPFHKINQGTIVHHGLSENDKGHSEFGSGYVLVLNAKKHDEQRRIVWYLMVYHGKGNATYVVSVSNRSGNQWVDIPLFDLSVHATTGNMGGSLYTHMDHPYISSGSRWGVDCDAKVANVERAKLAIRLFRDALDLDRITSDNVASHPHIIYQNSGYTGPKTPNGREGENFWRENIYPYNKEIQVVVDTAQLGMIDAEADSTSGWCI